MKLFFFFYFFLSIKKKKIQSSSRHRLERGPGTRCPNSGVPSCSPGQTSAFLTFLARRGRGCPFLTRTGRPPFSPPSQWDRSRADMRD